MLYPAAVTCLAVIDELFECVWSFYGVVLVSFWTYLIPYSTVSFVNFDQVNAGWDLTFHGIGNSCNPIFVRFSPNFVRFGITVP